MTHLTFDTTATVSAATDRGALMHRLEAVLHYSLGVVVALAAVAGIARLMDSGLPGCASARIDRTLQTIARHNGFTGAAIGSKQLVGKDQAAAICTAVLTAADGSRHTMSYRIFRNDQGRVRVSATFAAL